MACYEGTMEAILMAMSVTYTYFGGQIIHENRGWIYDGLPIVGPFDQCPPGYRKRVGNSWVAG